VGPASIENILLPEVAQLSAQLGRYLKIVIDDQAHVVIPGDGQDRFGHFPDFISSDVFGTKLDEISAAFAKLPGNQIWRAPLHERTVNEGIQPAIVK